MRREDLSIRVDRLVRLGRARNFNLEYFRKSLSEVCRSEDSGEVFRQLLTEWTGLPTGVEEARESWGQIERLFLTLREKLGPPLGLQTVLLHHLHSQTGLLKQPHLVSGRELTLLRFSAITDPLTGLYNRRFLSENLARQVFRAKRSGELLSVVMIDLQGFKSINDRFGHPTGDRALVRTAAMIRQSLRPGDSACRWGGDEFVAVLPKADLFASFTVAERIRQKVAEAARGLRAGLALGLYYGVASFPFDAKTADSLLKRADQRLYQCREQWRFEGGNRRRYPRFAPTDRMSLRLRPGRERNVWKAPVVNVAYGGLAFRARREQNWPPRGQAELSQREDADPRRVRIFVMHSGPLPDGQVRVGCKYA